MLRFVRWVGRGLLGLAALCAVLFAWASVSFGRPPGDTDMLAMWQAMTLVVGVAAAFLGVLLLSVAARLGRRYQQPAA